MGLDQYVFIENPKNYNLENKCPQCNNSPDKCSECKDEQVFYWRKHYDLNGWIAEEVCPPEITDFNCERIPLTKDHIMKLFNLVISKELSSYSSWQESSSEEYGIEDLIFIKTAMEHMRNGRELYYYAWW